MRIEEIKDVNESASASAKRDIYLGEPQSKQLEKLSGAINVDEEITGSPYYCYCQCQCTRCSYCYCECNYCYTSRCYCNCNYCYCYCFSCSCGDPENSNMPSKEMPCDYHNKTILQANNSDNHFGEITEILKSFEECK